MTEFKIREPIWGTRSIGLAAHKLGITNTVLITKKDKDGKLIYPNPYHITGEKARTYPTQRVKKYPQVVLHVIPIDDLEMVPKI